MQQKRVYPPPCLWHFVAYGFALPAVSPEHSSKTSLSIAVRCSDGVSPRETELHSNSLYLKDTGNLKNKTSTHKYKIDVLR